MVVGKQLRTWSNRPWNKDGRQLPLVHHASVGIEVKFRDFAALTRWVGQHVANTEGFRVSHIEWALTSKRRTELRRQVRTRAVEDAVIDAGSWSSCTSPKSSTGLVEGSHTFEVRATDASGNVDPTPASFTWTIDTTAPNTTITAPPSDPSNSAQRRLLLHLQRRRLDLRVPDRRRLLVVLRHPEELHRPRRRLPHLRRRAPPTPPATPTGRRPASPGRSTPTRRTPRSPPHRATRATPRTPTSPSPPAKAARRFECQLDGGSWSSCATPKSYTGLADGPTPSTSAPPTPPATPTRPPPSFTWTIDTDAPDTTITAQPSDPTNATGASFSFTSSEGGSTFECQRDGGGWASCASPKLYSGLSDGSHTFEVRATDAAGNTDPSPATDAWTVDTAAPNTTITAPPSNPSNSANADFSFTASEGGSTFECRIDGGRVVVLRHPEELHRPRRRAPTPSTSAPPTPQATPTATPASFTWTIDTTAPDTTITGPSPATRATPRTPTSPSPPAKAAPLRVPARRRPPVRPAPPRRTTPASPTAPTPSTSAPPTPPATPTRRPPASPGRSTPTRPGHHDHRPARATRALDREPRLLLHRQRRRLDVRLPARRRRLGRLHLARRLHRPRQRLPHLRRPRHRHRRQHRREPRQRHLDDRHQCPELDGQLPREHGLVQHRRLERRLLAERHLRHGV